MSTFSSNCAIFPLSLDTLATHASSCRDGRKGGACEHTHIHAHMHVRTYTYAHTHQCIHAHTRTEAPQSTTTHLLHGLQLVVADRLLPLPPSLLRPTQLAIEHHGLRQHRQDLVAIIYRERGRGGRDAGHTGGEGVPVMPSHRECTQRSQSPHWTI